MKSILTILLSAGLVSSVIILSFVPNVSAAESFKGYVFGNSGLHSSGVVGAESSCSHYTKHWFNPVRLLCDGLPDDIIGTASPSKAQYILFIQGLLSGSHQERVAGSFIIYTMLGYGPANRGLLPNDDNNPTIMEWKSRVNNPAIKMKYKAAHPYSINSGYGATKAGDGSKVLDGIYYPNSGSNTAYVFTDTSGKELYAIKIDCANPVGDMPGLPEAEEWEVSGESRIRINPPGGGAWLSDVNATPGQRVQWRHTLRNDGPDNMSSDVGYGVYPGNSPNGSRRGNAGSTFVNDQSTFRNITQADVGNTICRHIRWSPESSSSSGQGRSDEACVDVPYNYSLTPTIDVSSDDIPEGSTDPINGISANIGNTGPTISKSVRYAIARFVVVGDENTPIPGGTTSTGSGDWACAIAGHIGGTAGLSVRTGSPYCIGQELVKKNSEVISESGLSPVPIDSGKHPNDITGLDVSAGDRICYVAVVSMYNQNVGSNEFRYSDAKCVKIAKRPKLQAWGADVRAGSVTTSVTKQADKRFGSWAEYGIFAQGVISSASGAGLSSDHVGRAGATMPTDYNKLTFANTPSFGQYNIAPATALPVSFTVATGANTSGDRSVDDLQTGDGRWRTNGSLNVTGGTVASGKTIIINASHHVRISGNINYSNDSHSSVASLPQLIIIAPSIAIDDSVTNVSAWLVAQNGYISTCGSVTAPNWLSGLSTTACDQQLRIDGPVVAKHLYLRRTHGSGKYDAATGKHLGTPGEIINLRPDTYLWAYGNSRDTGAIRTMFVKELPPRF